MKRLLALLLAALVSLSCMMAIAAVGIPDELPVGYVSASTKLYKKASSNNGSVTTLKEKTKVEIIGESSSYYRVVVENRAGYVLKKYITIGEVSTETSSGKTVSVKNKKITLTIRDYGDDGLTVKKLKRTGYYSGELVDDVPNGKGEFRAQNSSGVSWTYTGEFKDGTFHGEGVSVWENGYTEEGTYTDGLYTPTAKELLNYLGEYSSHFTTFKVDPTTQKFVNDNPQLFPARSISEPQQHAKAGIGYRQLAKNINPYLNTLIDLKNVTISQIFEDNMVGHTITSMLLYDSDSNYYVAYYDGSVDKYQKDKISLYALPITRSSFSNVGGGLTNNVILYVSFIYS